MIHYLKTWPEPFDDVARGLKTWEYRADDRGFRVGDALVLEFWDPSPDRLTGKPMGYQYVNGPEVLSASFEVTYILHGGRFGIPVGYCIMSIKAIEGEA